MELEIIKEDTKGKLSGDNEKITCENIVKLYDQLESERKQQLEDVSMLRDEIYSKNVTPKNTWNAQINLPDIYELAQTLKSHLIENLYSHPEAMFDVSGTNNNSQKYANEQKAMLVDSFEKMKFESELEKIVDSVVEAGESTVFVGWKTKIKEIRRKNPLFKAQDGEEAYIIDSKVVYDGAIVKHVDCENFVFDAETKDDWDKCAKIYRNYQDIEQIRSNEFNNLLTKEKEEKLIALLDPKNKSKKAKSTRNNQVEILEFWGDFTLNSTTVFKNYLIVVAGRSEIIRFEPNPYVINPFIHANIIEDPQTRRGISPLKIAVSLNRLSSTILNKQLDALSLIINPPYLAPKGCFKGEQNVKPGKIIEYDAALMPNQPVALKFDSALRGWDFIQYFKNSIESATGIFKNMSGTLSDKDKTATEVTYSLSGQAVRLSMIIDSVNRKLIIPIVEKTADVIANFKFGNEIIAVKGQNGTTFLEIDDFVRSGDYVYRYGDRKATLERKYRFKEMFDVINAFAKIPEVNNQVDWLECFKFALEQYGVENSENFLRSEKIGTTENIT